MFSASEPNPVGLLGAMWIIEGLGEKMAASWSGRIEELTGFERAARAFCVITASNDDSHMDKLYGLIDRICTRESARTMSSAWPRWSGRLYAWQLEEIEVER